MNISTGQPIAAPDPLVERPAGSSPHGDPAVIPLTRRTEPVVLAPSEVDYLRDFVRTVSHREPSMTLMCARALRMLTDEGERDG